MRKALVPLMTYIIMHFRTIVIQNRLLPPAILKTMQMDLHPRRAERLHLLKKIKDAPVIHGIRYIKAYDM